MVPTSIRNAIIQSTFLGVEDHGIFTCYLHLNYGGSGQAFGGFGLDQWSEEDKRRIGTAYGLEFIKRVLNVLEVDSWEKLRGVHCRAKGTGIRIEAIAHILKDQWFYPEQDLEEFL